MQPTPTVNQRNAPPRPRDGDPTESENVMLLLKALQGAHAAVAGRLAAPVPYRKADEAWPVAEERVAAAVLRHLAGRLAPQEGAAAPARRVAVAVRQVEEARALYGHAAHAVHEVTLV